MAYVAMVAGKWLLLLSVLTCHFWFLLMVGKLLVDIDSNQHEQATSMNILLACLCSGICRLACTVVVGLVVVNVCCSIGVFPIAQFFNCNAANPKRQHGLDVLLLKSSRRTLLKIWMWFSQNVVAYIHTYPPTCIHTHKCMHAYMHTVVHFFCLYIYIFTYIYLYVYT